MNKTKLIALGFDGGNGYTKLMMESNSSKHSTHRVKLPAAIFDTTYSSTVFKDVNPKSGSFIEYLDGDRVDLIGSSWLSGYAAQTQQPIAHSRVVDDVNGKVKYGLMMLLGSLGTLPLTQGTSLACVSSIPNSSAHGEDIAKSLTGLHKFRINCETEMSIHILNETIEEGVGTVAHILSNKLSSLDDQIGVLDIGNGTIISCVYEDMKVIKGSRNVIPSGVDDLVSAICKADETMYVLKQEAKKHLITKGIEDGTFQYGYTGWNFEGVYTTELKNWVTSLLAIAMKGVYPWMANCSKFYACGGGAELPFIRPALEAKGVTVLDDPQMANVSGLYKLALKNK